jgi:hypothetical protein
LERHGETSLAVLLGRYRQSKAIAHEEVFYRHAAIMWENGVKSKHLTLAAEVVT